MYKIPNNCSRFIKINILFIGIAVFYLFLAPAVSKAADSLNGEIKSEIPLGLDESALVIPQDNPMTKQKVELGRLLFFDKRLSRDNTISCGSCHMPEFAFTDGKPVSTGIKGQKGGRSAPTVINRAFSTVQFWDGRAATLEEQALGPLVNPIEHGFPNHDELIQKLNRIKGYQKEFQTSFGTDVTKEGIAKAIAAFERTIISGNSRFDQYDVGGKDDALSEAEKKGLALFRGKARCTKCHSGFNFTDEKFHNLGIGMDRQTPDLGRFEVTKVENDKGAFKAPTLREISRTAPYMHDGRFKALEEVVDFYNKGGIKNPYQDALIIPLELTEEEKKEVVAFLQTLNGEGWQHVKAPLKFPQ
jgi:cytochrome c peroxidase